MANAFSFTGRIRRSEYGISFIVYFICYAVLTGIAKSGGGGGIILILWIPLQWFLWAQGAKRCHDLGNSGWYQIIPFYVFWLIFQDGQAGTNEYGENPKDVQASDQQNSEESEDVKILPDGEAQNKINPDIEHEDHTKGNEDDKINFLN